METEVIPAEQRRVIRDYFEAIRAKDGAFDTIPSDGEPAADAQPLNISPNETSKVTESNESEEENR